VFKSSAVFKSSVVLKSIQSGHLLERLFEQELRYTVGPTVRQECTLIDSRTSPRRGGRLKQALSKCKTGIRPGHDRTALHSG